MSFKNPKRVGSTVTVTERAGVLARVFRTNGAERAPRSNRSPMDGARHGKGGKKGVWSDLFFGVFDSGMSLRLARSNAELQGRALDA